MLFVEYVDGFVLWVTPKKKARPPNAIGSVLLKLWLLLGVSVLSGVDGFAVNLTVGVVSGVCCGGLGLVEEEAGVPWLTGVGGIRGSCGLMMSKDMLEEFEVETPPLSRPRSHNRCPCCR